MGGKLRERTKLEECENLGILDLRKTVVLTHATKGFKLRNGPDPEGPGSRVQNPSGVEVSNSAN